MAGPQRCVALGPFLICVDGGRCVVLGPVSFNRFDGDDQTCYDEGTPSGTGFSNVNGFVPSLYDTLGPQLCIDTTREFAAGESSGGMMTYQLGVDMASHLAVATSPCVSVFVSPQLARHPKNMEEQKSPCCM